MITVIVSLIALICTSLVIIILAGLHLTFFVDHPLSYFLEFIPDYILVILSTTIIFTKFPSKLWVFFLLLFMIFIVSPIQVNIAERYKSKLQLNTLNIASFNVAQRVDEYKLYDWFNSRQLDVLFVQEARDKQFNASAANNLYSSCKPRLCILSRYPITDYEVIDRRALGGWGLFASLHSIKVGKNEIFLMNTHFASISNFGYEFSSLDGFLSKVRLFRESKAIEFGLVKSTLRNYVHLNPLIVAGDFNITDRNPQYKEYWGEFDNLFLETGLGYGSTRIHSWLTPRIDHLLVSNAFQTNHTWVDSNLGSDHLPIIGSVNLPEERQND